MTDGYGTMLSETDRQVAGLTGGLKPSLFFVSVGVGSWAHSVVSHYKGADEKNCIVAVEPTVAASLKESLHCGQLSPIQTGETVREASCLALGDSKNANGSKTVGSVISDVTGRFADSLRSWLECVVERRRKLPGRSSSMVYTQL